MSANSYLFHSDSMTPSLHIGIAGAGLLGRLLAWRLVRAGHSVQVFDAAIGPGPVFRSQAPEQGYVPTAAGFTAAGMLSPMAELDNAEPAVAALGWRSIELWRQIVAALPEPRPLLSVQGSMLLAHRGDAGAAQRVLDRLAHASRSPLAIPRASYRPQPHSRRRSWYTPRYSRGQGRSGWGAAASMWDCRALRRRASAAPLAMVSCQGCALHHDAVRCAAARMASMVLRGSGSGRKARQL